MDMMNISKETQTKIDKIKLAETSAIVEKDSQFIGYATRVSNVTDVKLAYFKVKQNVPEADHIMMVYAVKQPTGYHDNGEHGAGKKIAAIQTG